MKNEIPTILILHEEQVLPESELEELSALPSAAGAAATIRDALQACRYQAELFPVRESLDDLHDRLSTHSPERVFIFNNCDGFMGVNYDAYKVLSVIEELDFGHTGSDASTTILCTDKQKSKECLLAAGVSTPRYRVYTQPERAFPYEFPAIVKPVKEDGSIGIDLDSVVTGSDALYQKLEDIFDRFDEPALVEEYIDGRELAVSLWGNGRIHPLPISEEDYSHIADPLKHIISYEAKWITDSYYYQNILLRCPAPLESDDYQRIVSAAEGAYRAVSLQDFGRLDIRYRDGIAYVVDINEIPDLSPDAGFANSSAKAGYSYEQTIQHILELALERQGWRK